MAPEALRGHPASPAQDVWAAGAVALSALDPGADPRTVDSSGLVRTPGIDGSGPELAVARGLATVLGDLLDEDPGRRPGAAEARDALTRLLAEGADDVGGTSGADASAAAPAASADPAFHAADGQPFEVFDQLEPLPIGGPGTGLALVPPDGPGALPVRGGGLHARLQQRAGERGDRPSPTPPTSAVEHPDVADVQDTTRSASSPGALGAAGTPAPVGTPEPEVPTRLLPSTPPAASTSAPSAASSNAVPSTLQARHGAAIPALLALGTLAIVMAIVLGFLAFRGSPSDGGSPTPPASPTESPSPSDVTDPTEEESASMESTASATSDDDPSTTVAPGDACQWNEEGTTGMGTDGRTLICTKSGDDAYTWEET
jgi:serine/threonine-protein kinase